METRMGRCIYCGCEIGVMAGTQEEADMQATKMCSCEGAELGMKKSLLNEKLNEVAGELAPNYGFVALEPETYELVSGIGDAVVEGKITSASIRVDGTIIVFKGNDKKVSVHRSYTVKQGGNIER